MKHSLKITSFLLLFFLIAQFLGIAILYKYIDTTKSAEEGKTVFKDSPLGERPVVDENFSFISVIIAVLLGTGLAFILLKYDLIWIWKSWFFVAITLTLTTALSAFFTSLTALIIAVVAAGWKILKPNFWIHNVTELFIYGGLAAIFVPWFNVLSISILLILIAVYDAYAVWKSKHMITLAKSQAKAKIFAGLLIPYKIRKEKEFSAKDHSTSPAPKTKHLSTVRTAILGGGDIGFPLLFAGVLLKEYGLWQSLVIPFFAAAGLGFLLWYSDEKKFYPAIPFIAAGCFLGLGVVLIISRL